MSDLKKRYLQDAEVVGEGTFKLDRARAMEKMAQFQLEDPHRYVLELVAAAVCAGAPEVIVRNDADDLELTWDGLHPTADELDALFDHIFSTSDDPRQRMLQHLAQGLYGALGLKPRWIKLERPGLSLDLTDPLAVARQENRRASGVFVHVRERFSWKVVREAILPFDPVYETKLLKEHARLAPIPVRVNGAEINAFDAPPGAAEIEGGRAWLARGERFVQLVRDGLIVQGLGIHLGPLALEGWARADGLRLNASRSAVVEDAAFHALQARLQALAADLLRGRLTKGQDDPDAAEAALRLLRWYGEARAALGALPLLKDILGRTYSLEALEAEARILSLEDTALADERHPPPQFLAGSGAEKGGRDALQWAILNKFFSKKLESGDKELKELAAGWKRRRELARSVEPLHFGDKALLQRSFQEEGFEGVVAILRDAQPGDKARLRAELRVEGLPVEEIDLPAAAPLRARLQGDQLQADAAFSRVVPGVALHAAKALLSRQADRVIGETAAAYPDHPAVQAALLRWLDGLRLPKGKSMAQRLEGAPPALLSAPLFPRVVGGRASLAELAKEERIEFVRAETWGEIRRLALSAGRQIEYPGALARLLALSGEENRALRRVSGSVYDATDDALAAMKAAARRAQPPARPRLWQVVEHQRHVDLPGLMGIIGLRSDGPCAARVIREGVEMAEIPLPLPFAGGLASVSWDGAEPDRAWERLADPAAAGEELAGLLRPAFQALAAEALRRAPLAAPLPRWALAALLPPLEPSLEGVAWLQTAAGQRRTLAQVKQAMEADPKAKVRFLEQPPREPVPGLDDVLLLDPLRRQALEAHLTPARLADESRRVAGVLEKREKFREKTTAARGLTPPGPWTAIEPIQAEGLAGQCGLSLDPAAAPGLTIRCLHQDRELARIQRQFPLPAEAVLQGPAVAPNDTFTDLATPALRSRAVLLAETAAEAAFARITGSDAAPGVLQLRLLALLQSGKRLPEMKRQTKAKLRDMLEKQPLFPLPGGGAVSLADVREAAAAGRLQVLSAEPARLPPGDRLWIVASPLVREALQGAIPGGLPAGDDALRAWAAGERRRQELPEVPLVPAGSWLASWLVEEGGRSAWLALSAPFEEGRRQLVVEWSIEGRIVQEEQRHSPISIRARVRDAALKPDERFAAPQPGKELDAARAWLDEQVERFLLGVGEQVRLGKPPAPAAAGPRVRDVERCRTLALAFAARARKVAGWSDAPLVECADGRLLAPPELVALARRGPLRIVHPQAVGRTLDPDLPAIRIYAREALQLYGRVEEFDEQLAKETAILRRREAAPSPAQPRPGAVLTRPAPGGREGFVQVMPSGEVGIRLHVGWRALDEGASPGPVPLQGAISDDKLSADAEFRKVHRDVAYRKLTEDLTRLSESLLPELLASADPDAHRPLWRAVLRRAFPERSALKAPTGPRKRLAELPLFQDGEGRPLSAADLAKARDIAWIPLGASAPPVDPARPFVRASRSEFDQLQPLLGGTWAEGEIAEAQAIHARRSAAKQPLALPGGPWLAQRDLEADGIRAVLGLDPALPRVGALRIRCGGVPVEEQPVTWPGLVAVVEIPAAQVHRSWERADLTAPQRRALEDAWRALVAAAAPAIAPDAGRMERVGQIAIDESVAASAREPFLAAPLLRTLQGAASLRDAQRAAKASPPILWGDPADLDGLTPPPLSLCGGPAELALLKGAGLEATPARQWAAAERQRQAKEAARTAEAARRQAIEELAAVCRGHLQALLGDLPDSKPLIEVALSRVRAPGPRLDAALADPDGAAGWLLAGEAADAALQAQGGWPERCAELWVRVAEALPA